MAVGGQSVGWGTKLVGLRDWTKARVGDRASGLSWLAGFPGTRHVPSQTHSPVLRLHRGLFLLCYLSRKPEFIHHISTLINNHMSALWCDSRVCQERYIYTSTNVYTSTNGYTSINVYTRTNVARPVTKLLSVIDHTAFLSYRKCMFGGNIFPVPLRTHSLGLPKAGLST